MPVPAPQVSLAERPIMHPDHVVDEGIRFMVGAVSAERAVMDLDADGLAAVQERLAETSPDIPDRLAFIGDFGRGAAEGAAEATRLHRDLAYATPEQARRLGAWTIATAFKNFLDQERASIAFGIEGAAFNYADTVLDTSAAEYVEADQDDAMEMARKIRDDSSARQTAADLVAQELINGAGALSAQETAAQAQHYWRVHRNSLQGDQATNEGWDYSPYVHDNLMVAARTSVDERVQQSSGFVQRVVAGAEAEPAELASSTPLDHLHYGANRAVAWLAAATDVYISSAPRPMQPRKSA